MKTRIKSFLAATKSKIRKNRFYQKVEPYYHGKIYKRLLEEEKEITTYFKENADITTMKKAGGEMRAVQEGALGFADEVLEYLKPLDIHPFMIGGTLIGAIRHKGFIPWDDDLDFGLTREEYNKVTDFCKEHMHYELYEGSLSKYTSETYVRRIEECIKKHPNELVLEIAVDQIQIWKGDSIMNRKWIDFFPKDSFRASYTMDEHIAYLDWMKKKRAEIDKVNLIYDFVQKEVKNNENLDPDGPYFQHGIDHRNPYGKTGPNSRFMKRSSMFPLRTMEFEGRQWLAPNVPEDYVSITYGDYMAFPDDVGREKHSYWVDYAKKYLPNVEFYLTDVREIDAFVPMYEEFRKQEIFARFVAEPCEINTAGDRFDYETAIARLKEKQLFFTRKCDPHADLAITTQAADCLEKYKKKKARLLCENAKSNRSVTYWREDAGKVDYCLDSSQDGYLDEITQKIKEWAARAGKSTSCADHKG